MKIKKIYNFLDGKNLCNIFASIIVNEIKKLTPDAKTEISVTNVRSFFVVRGRTTSDRIINLTDLIEKNMHKYPKSIKNIRIIDTILYNTNFSFNKLNINRSFTKNTTGLNEQDFVNYHALQGIYFNLHINEQTKTIYFDTEEKIDDVKNIISSTFIDYEILHHNMNNETYTSDRFFGLSNNSEKLYYILIESMKNHLFDLGICSYLNINLKSNLSFEQIDNDNIFITVDGSKSIVKINWLESLLLDIFPIKLSDLTSTFLINDYDFSNVIIPNNDEKPWEKLNYISDFVLF